MQGAKMIWVLWRAFCRRFLRKVNRYRESQSSDAEQFFNERSACAKLGACHVSVTPGLRPSNNFNESDRYELLLRIWFDWPVVRLYKPSAHKSEFPSVISSDVTWHCKKTEIRFVLLGYERLYSLQLERSGSAFFLWISWSERKRQV